jgi:integrase
MRAIIGAKLLAGKRAQAAAKPFEVRDSRLHGFILRVQPSGARSYYAQIARGRRIAIGKADHFKPDEARERCEKVLGNVAHGRPPLHGLDGADELTLGEFIAATYAAWARAYKPRTAESTLERVKLHFGAWYGRPLTSVTIEDLESWRMKRINGGTSPATIRRDLAALAGVLTRAVKLGKLPENVVRRVERPRIDRTPKVRYLDTGEESRLRTALRARDEEMREARESANRWRKAREQELLPKLRHFGDHLTAAVLVSMNSGLRRGELLALHWAQIDFKEKLLTVEGATAKSGSTRHVPLNDEALDVLKRWREQVPDADRVFDVATSFKTAWAALLTRASILRFRWHDLRHHFASRLAQAGVPLNTVRELLGHASMSMTIRYAHLAPDQKREAVAKLVRP